MKLYVVVCWADSQDFIQDYSDQIILINDDEGYKQFGDSAYFVPVEIYKQVYNLEQVDDYSKYVVVSSPKSQKYLKEYPKKVFPICWDVGIELYGKDSCFVPLELYEE